LEGSVVAVASKAASGAAGKGGPVLAKDVAGKGGVVANPESRAPKSPAGARAVEAISPAPVEVATKLASGGGGGAVFAVAVEPAESGAESGVDVVTSTFGLASDSVGEAAAVEEPDDPSGALDASRVGSGASSGDDSAPAPSTLSLVPVSLSTGRSS